MSCIVIFGGSGFIGTFFADFLLNNGVAEKIYLVDVESPLEKPFPFRHRIIAKHGERIEFVRLDVREKIEFSPPEPVFLTANFAAVHREPGHLSAEYFETNLRGAENVCDWATRIECENLIFTSSISPYGVSELTKDETTLPVPVTAYGASKLVAEKIHNTWQAWSPNKRRLVIARPGVVFGPGEGGNVTRLVRAVSRGYFCYMGNRATRKAGIYVKELCNALWWTFKERASQSEFPILFNGTMNPGPSIEEYVNAVISTRGRRAIVPTAPFPLLLAASYLIDGLAKPLRITHPFDPVRMRKLVRSNNVLPSFLISNGYNYIYTLRTAMDDWKLECPDDWDMTGQQTKN
ncbi:NAD(P)-dependent oxidoreductase [Stenotrophomonas sp. Ste96]|uniref:NAD-dependent epimerase/dehydratase family protein n=1 Tax=Stenotrophomonas sp. Ste96 TaxID=2926029 RepID=UPI0021C8EBAB|nr:NAD(P)-dependent oxidoreductase [Stenotrophomonas sp. Ste96]